ncbi:MAG: hypothetical protein DMG86_20125 [Acidobacteria bacterium]|nr:MAG: hypothetical protein DMG86_20125 [Acidobacteriota bacterium]
MACEWHAQLILFLCRFHPESGQPGEVVARIRRHDGVFRWFLMRVEPLRDETGKIVRWYGTQTDIEDHKRKEDLATGEKLLLEMVTSGHSARCSSSNGSPRERPAARCSLSFSRPSG